MGFPNVDIFLTAKFIERFNEAKIDPTFIIQDLFDDLPEAEQLEMHTLGATIWLRSKCHMELMM